MNISDLEQGVDRNFPWWYKKICLIEMNSIYDEARVEESSSVDFDFPYNNLGLKSKLYSLIFSFLANLA